MIFKHAENDYFFARSLDTRVREKRFCLLPQENLMVLEMIYEETGKNLSTSISVSPWEFGFCSDDTLIYQRHQQHLQDTYKIPTWESRTDVPKWVREISLIVTIHMEHWTGYTFNTYRTVIEKAHWIAKHINPRNVLLYLPGWDGRYYWNYGEYSPADSMGGRKGFEEMMTQLNNMGFRTMLMVGMNMVSKTCENFEQWGQPSLSMNVSGIPQYTLVDWDGSRHYLHGFNAMLTIGAPGWQTHLIEEVLSLHRDFAYDAMFFDISAAWTNEQSYDDFEGISSFIKSLKSQLPEDILIAGEGWYDALATLTPLMQCGHTDGLLHYHDEPYSPMFDTYCRNFGHLCLGDLGRGSTGVHELGYNPIQTVPYRKGVIPTLAIVENTLEVAEDKVLEVIHNAIKYQQEFI
ncbi:hypothetical protein [Aequitasia blattaphilus]|nr:hypothetical protein [Aequitasia blattaphilus]